MIAAGRDPDVAACLAMLRQSLSPSAVVFSLDVFFFDCFAYGSCWE